MTHFRYKRRGLADVSSGQNMRRRSGNPGMSLRVKTVWPLHYAQRPIGDPANAGEPGKPLSDHLQV